MTGEDRAWTEMTRRERLRMIWNTPPVWFVVFLVALPYLKLRQLLGLDTCSTPGCDEPAPGRARQHCDQHGRGLR